LSGIETHPAGISNSGEIVGYIDAFLPPHNCCEVHAFVFKPSVLSLFDVSGSILTTANGINDRGEIIGDYIDNKDEAVHS
jgi:hypothetical protein